MKKLFLLRHAHAEVNHGDDLKRPLTDEGILKCQAIESVLEPCVKEIDLILSSNSVRTKQTIDNSLINLKDKQVILDNALYHASEEKLLEYLSNIEYQVSFSPKSVLLVNHNPSISHLATFLAQESTLSPYYLDLLNHTQEMECCRDCR